MRPREPNPYGYRRVFTYVPHEQDRRWLQRPLDARCNDTSVLYPTAGGGSIPLEAGRIGLSAIANDLNPVAALILKATED